ncbi:MAG: NAD(P)H-dependent oxidoreductase [Oscillospiraceae bacterium]|nr:NAD(P)H-dependent oxidoreductase [Oscillospiraceae bacterium]
MLNKPTIDFKPCFDNAAALRVAVFHGSPRKGNTYRATKIFMDELSKCGDVSYYEFSMPKDLPAFCCGCKLCLGGMLDKCPSAQFVAPILDAIINADALVFATPHYGASSMPGSMKNLFDHLDFLVLTVSPREEIFSKKAFIITTGSGSAAAIGPIKKVLLHWGVNRVFSIGIRMFTNKWDSMSAEKQSRCEKSLRHKAIKFYNAKKRRPHCSTIAFYHMSKFILKNYVGKGNYPYELWKEKGYFKKRPF